VKRVGALVSATALVAFRAVAAVIRSVIGCACQRRWGRIVDVVAGLEVIRIRCPALRMVYLPESIWPSVRTQALAPPDALGHRSILFYALQRGHLSRLTRPIHHFLLSGPTLRPDVTLSYRNALMETWMLKPTEVKRHVASKKFFGKVAELQVAEWLSSRGWNIVGLEARSAPVDLTGISPSGDAWGVEVKRIAQDDVQFAMILASLNGPAGGPVPVYAPPNYPSVPRL